MINIQLYVDKEKYASVKEALEILGIGLSLFNKLKKEKIIKPVKIGKTHYYLKKNLGIDILKKYADFLEKTNRS